MTDDQSLLTTAQAAERAGVSARVVRDAIARQELPAERGRARSWNIRAQALDAWMAARAGESERGGTEKAQRAAPTAAAAGRAGGDPPTPPGPDAILITDERPFVLHHGFDGWLDVRDLDSQPAEDGGHLVALEPAYLAGRREVNFTRYYPEEARWEGQDHALMLTT